MTLTLRDVLVEYQHALNREATAVETQVLEDRAFDALRPIYTKFGYEALREVVNQTDAEILHWAAWHRVLIGPVTADESGAS